MPDYVFSNVWKERDRESWGNFNYGLLIRIKKGVAIEEVRKKMQNVIRVYKMQKEATNEGKTLEQYIKENGEIKILLDQLKTARLHGTPSSMGATFPEGRGNLQMLYIMTGLSILILFLSFFNYINLATADAIKRAKEVGVRKILGATKGNIVMQFIFETILISVFSILSALVIVELSLPHYNNFLGKKLIIYGGQFYMQLGMLFVLTLLFAGVFPAVYVANFETLKVLKGNFGRSKSGVWLRNGMLILQFAIASFFIMGSYIVHEQVNFMMNKDLGFNGRQVIKIPFKYKIPNRKLEGYETTKQEIMKIKGVEQVSTFEGTFGGDTNSTSGFTHNGIFVQGHNVNMDYGFLEMMKIKVVLGRDLSPKLASDTINSMLMNETCVKTLKLKNPINTIIKSGWGDGIHDGNLKFKIVGVVKDFNITGLQNKIPPMVFTHIKTLKWDNFYHVYVKVSPGNLKETLEQLESYWKKNVDNDYPFEYEFVDKGFAKTYSEQIKQRNLFSLLNAVVILIALFGLFALASFSIQRRMKEIAIRKTLGAETNVLLKELSKQYIVFCVIGFLIALFPVYYLLSKWLENFAYRIEITVLPFIVGFVVLLVLTLVVVLTRAYQATRVDVLKYLKYE
jgi:putative ABC transport system permease protein